MLAPLERTITWCLVAAITSSTMTETAAVIAVRGWRAGRGEHPVVFPLRKMPGVAGTAEATRVSDHGATETIAFATIVVGTTGVATIVPAAAKVMAGVEGGAWRVPLRASLAAAGVVETTAAFEMIVHATADTRTGTRDGTRAEAAVASAGAQAALGAKVVPAVEAAVAYSATAMGLAAVLAVAGASMAGPGSTISSKSFSSPRPSKTP
mmetsp:Transcript_13800/g.41690  ORF Transcript_13800/g.41690 Transcript_13800/m.41690 type:complete len:209 (+) Transcript_13800:246-872(+)